MPWGVEEIEVTRLFFWVNPISDKSQETRRPRGLYDLDFYQRI